MHASSIQHRTHKALQPGQSRVGAPERFQSGSPPTSAPLLVETSICRLLLPTELAVPCKRLWNGQQTTGRHSSGLLLETNGYSKPMALIQGLLLGHFRTASLNPKLRP